MKRHFTALAGLLGLRPRDLIAVIGVLLVLSQALAVIWLSAPLLIMNIFDGVLDTKNMNTLLSLLLMFVVVQLVGVVLATHRHLLINAAAMVLERRLFAGTVWASVAEARLGQPEQAAGMLTGYDRLRQFLHSSATTDLLNLLMVPLPFLFIFLLHPILGWLMLGAIIVLSGFSVITEMQGRAALKHAAGLSARASSTLGRQLQRRDEVEGLGLLPGIVRHWLPLRREALGLENAAADRAAALASIGACLSKLFTSMFVVMVAYLVIHRQASPAVFVASLHMIPRVLHPFDNVAAQWLRWSAALLSLREMLDVLAQADQGGAAEPVPGEAALQLEGLRLEVPGSGQVLVDDLTLSVPPGSLVAVTGPNGAGKSTLLRALLGMSRPAGGSVLFQGCLMYEAKRDAIGPRIGFLGQRPQLLRGTILENIGRFSDDVEGALLAARLAGAHEMIGRLPLGYSTPCAGETGLSGGQMRQVALARALYGNPGLLVLDEPEVGLDTPALAALLAAVTEMRRQGAIIFLVTHSLKRWATIADIEVRLLGGGAVDTRLLQAQPLVEAAS